MKKFLFIGIDSSKSKFDVSILESIEQKNILKRPLKTLKQATENAWIGKQSKIKCEVWRFCGEHTGLYSRGLLNFFRKKDCLFGLQILCKSKGVQVLNVQKQTVSIRL